jgi:NAD kinase
VSSSSISPQPASAARPISRIAIFTHGRPETVADAFERAGACARAAGVEVVATVEEDVDLVVALGGDGTMLRALRATLGSASPVFGIKFGRVGFLTTASSRARTGSSSSARSPRGRAAGRRRR